MLLFKSHMNEQYYLLRAKHAFDNSEILLLFLQFSSFGCVLGASFIEAGLLLSSFIATAPPSAG